MDSEQVFEEVRKCMECRQLILVGNKNSYDKKSGELKTEYYYLKYMDKHGVQCNLTFTKTYDVKE